MSAKSRDAWRKNNPIKHAYNSLKNNAKRRGKFFDLTFEQFKEFAVEVAYMENKGRKFNSLHIDRKDETKGYTLSNIQVLENSENLRKFAAFKYRDQQGPHFETVTSTPFEGEDYPF